MKKEGDLIFHRVLLIVIGIFLVDAVIFFGKYGFSKGITGFSIKGAVSKAYSEISPVSKTFLIVQWVVLIILLVAVYRKDKSVKSRKEELVGINLEKMSKKSKTDLDTLYNVLKNKKQLSISAIAKLFKVKKEVAMEWCKILESGNLAVIDHPSSREPMVRVTKNGRESKKRYK